MQKLDGMTQDRLSLLNKVGAAGIENAAQGLSQMVGQAISVSPPSVQLIPLQKMPAMLGGLENEAIGIYLKAEGAMSGQIMMILPYEHALKLVDLLFDAPPGTTNSLGRMERSALAELGNLAASFFLNKVADITGQGTRPTPPAVMVDMVGAILDIVIATSGSICDEIVLLRSSFMNGSRSVETGFWVIPDPETLAMITGADGRKNS